MTQRGAWDALARMATLHLTSGGVEELSETLLGELMGLVEASAGQLLLAADLRTLASLPVNAESRISLPIALDSLADGAIHWDHEAHGSTCCLPLKLREGITTLLLLSWDHPAEGMSMDEVERLLPFVALALSHRRIEAELTARQVQLEELGARYDDAMQRAITDGLTGLLNHTHFKEMLGLELGRSRRYGNHLTLLILDVDYFKKINDTYGHLMGDVVIRRIAQTFRSLVRDCDLLARYGGEEFAILLPQTDLKGAMIVADRIRLRVRDLIFQTDDQEPVPAITISIGVAEMHKLDTVTTFLERADQALYRAKQGGRNRVCSEADDVLSVIEAHDQAENHRRAFLIAITEMASEVAVKDAYLSDYADQLGRLSEALGAAVGLAPHQRRDLSLAAGLHHLGKIALPGELLAKQSPLSEPEWDLVKAHPQLSQQLIGQIAGMGAVAEMILYHHEHWDGSGYPYGLKGEQIPLGSRVLAVIDCFIAMINHRPYRPAMSRAEARLAILEGSGTHFDPQIAETFDRLLQEGEPDPLLGPAHT